MKLLAIALALLALTATPAPAAPSACPSTNSPNELVLAGGSAQQAQLGKPFGESLRVALANTNGCPLTGNPAGVSVEFDAPGSGASGIFASSGTRTAYVGTDAQGIATAPQLIANHTTGNYSVEAHSDYGSVSLSLSNTANGLPAAIAAATAASQAAAVNAQYAQPLQARITDANGNPVQDAAVTFAVVPGATGAGATFLGGAAQATTDSDGVATAPPLLANGVPGRFTVVASTDGLPAVASFTLDNHAAAMTLATVSAHGPSATVDTQFRNRLAVHLVDASGQPVEGATVTFGVQPAAGGAGATFVDGQAQATVLTDVNGVATAPALVANKSTGAFTASASVAGATTARFTLKNRAGAPYAVAAGAASGETTSPGARFPVPLAVTVTDREGNPVVHATVVFSAPHHGAGGHFRKRSRRVRVRTNANGIAVAPPFTANGTVGGYVVTATVKGTSKRAAFALGNVSPA